MLSTTTACVSRFCMRGYCQLNLRRNTTRLTQDEFHFHQMVNSRSSRCKLRLDMHVDETDSKDHSTWLQENEEQIWQLHPSSLPAARSNTARYCCRSQVLLQNRRPVQNDRVRFRAP